MAPKDPADAIVSFPSSRIINGAKTISRPEALDVNLLPFLPGGGIVTGNEIVPFPDQNQNAHHGEHQRQNNENDHSNSLINRDKDSDYFRKRMRPAQGAEGRERPDQNV